MTFLYALKERVRIYGRGKTIYVIVRRRYDEGTVSSFIQYVLVPEDELDQLGQSKTYAEEYEADLIPITENAP